MAVVDSKQQMLDINTLLFEAAENVKDSKYPVEMVYASFVQEAQMPNSKFLRYGNTIFIIHGDLQRPGVGQFRALIADTAQNFLQGSYQFVIDAYKAGYFMLYTKFQDRAILNVFEIIQRNPPNQGMGFQLVRQDPDGMYVVQLMLGDPNGTNLAAPQPIDRPPSKNGMQSIETAVVDSGVMDEMGGAPMQPPMGGDMPPMNAPQGGNPPAGGLGQLANNPMQGEV